MEHLGTKRMETERLILRPFVMEDADAMFRNWASDPAVTRYMTWPTYEKKETADLILSQWTASYKDPGFYQWAIELKSIGEAIGSISVVFHNDKICSAHMGYCIGSQWWGQGIMTEALRALLDFLFDEVGFNRVEAMHDTNNPASGAVMRKCGMKQEGIFRQYIRSNLGIGDASMYALLASDRKGVAE